MHFENHFHGDRSSRLFVLRRSDSAIFDGRRTLAGRSDGTTPGARRAIAGAVSASMAKIAAVLGACGEFEFSRAFGAVVSWIFEQAFEGCAAYAAAMYGIPVGELPDSSAPADDPQTGREHTVRLLSPTSGEISANARGNVLYLPDLSTAAIDAGFVAQSGPEASPGWIASMVAALRSRIRRRRECRLAATELQSFDDRRLRDVGIYRCDIEYFVRYGSWRE